VIIGLSGWVYSEYVNNSYFQSYINSLSPILVPILSVGFGIASATAATLLYFTMRNIRQREATKTEDMPRRRSPIRKPVKKAQVPSSKIEKAAARSITVTPRPMVLNTETPSPRRGATKADTVDVDESD
jgi:hypothetical protein